MNAALAISAAVVRQQACGEGDLIDVSLLDSDLALMAPRIAAYLAGESEPAPSGGTDSVLAVYQGFSTADRDIVVAIGNDTMWQRFCVVLELNDLANDPALKDNAGRRLQRSRLTEIIARKLAQRPAVEWLKMFGEAEVPASLAQTLSEVTSDHQVMARGSLLPVPGSSTLFSVRSPFRLASMPEPRNTRFPDLGADTREVLESMGVITRAHRGIGRGRRSSGRAGVQALG